MEMRVRSFVLLLALAVFGGPVLAQETTGQIAGRIADPQGLGVPGATVIVFGAQGSKSTTSGSDGRFTVPFLTPGAYSVRAELQGFKAVEQKDVNVSLGKVSELSLKMEVGGVTEVVQVTGAVSAIDTTSTTIGAVLNTEQLASIPVGRRVADALYLAPGVSSSGTLGRMNPSISGGSGLENQYVVDGANVTNAGYGGLGSYSIVFGSLGNATPYDFVKEIQVKTGGYEAEYGQATGGVVNVITKSGTNQYHGSLFAYGQPKWLESPWTQFQAANGSINTSSTSVSDAGVEGGGPVIKNHLFFFGAIDPSWQQRVFTAPPNFPLASLGQVPRDRRTVSYAAKATVQLNSAHHVDASFFGDPSHGATGPQRTSSLLVTPTASAQTPAFSTIDFGGHQQAVRYDGVINSHFLVEASFSRANNTINELPSVNQWRVTDTTVTPNVITGGIGFYEAGNQSLNRQGAIKATNIFGGHQIKYGVEYSNVAYNQLNNLTGPTFVGPDGRTTATGASISVLPDVTFGKIYRVTRARYNTGHNTAQKYTDFFVQDTWRVGDRLTINPGVRYDTETLDGDLITGWQLKNNWAPRLGAAYDLTGDGKTKLYGNYGVFFARIPNDLAARALSADDGYTRADYFDAGLTRFITNGTATRQTPTGAITTTHFILAGIGADTIDPASKLSYTNEVVLGFEREVTAGTTLGFRYVFRNMPRVLEDVANCPMAAYDTAASATACASVDYILTNPSSATPVNAAAIAAVPGFSAVKFDDPVHTYNSFEFTLNKRASHWNSMASYRYSRLRGNFEGFYRDDNGQSDPAISSLYDFPTNDPTYVKQYPGSGDIRFLGDPNGILPLDRPHQVKLYGNYMFTNGLNLGTGINLSSGKPLTPMYANPNYSSAGEIPGAARGTGIQTVDGFMERTPFESQLDLQASWSHSFSGRKITFMADVFNLFNQTRITGYDQDVQLNAGAPNPDFGKPVNSLLSGTPPQFQAPRNMRVGVRFEF
jgi:outer membrane receptor protein involved in Fe transport